jgi:hypothetical protein
MKITAFIVVGLVFVVVGLITFAVVKANNAIDKWLA